MVTELSLEHDRALGDWWCCVRDEHGTYDFEESVRAAVAAEAAGCDWVPGPDSWAPNEVREFLHELFDSGDEEFFKSFLNGWTDETGADEEQQVVADAWSTLRAMGRRDGILTLHSFFGGNNDGSQP